MEDGYADLIAIDAGAIADPAAAAAAAESARRPPQGPGLPSAWFSALGNFAIGHQLQRPKPEVGEVEEIIKEAWRQLMQPHIYNGRVWVQDDRRRYGHLRLSVQRVVEGRPDIFRVRTHGEWY